MDKDLKKELAKQAINIRRGVVEGTFNAKSGHPGGSLDLAEILAYLYFVKMNIDPKDPKKEDRDRFVLSKGHAAPALYATLAYRGFFDVEDLKTLRKTDSYLQGHPNMNYVPGVDMSTGSLGQGISAACGMALASKMQGGKFHVYAVLGDGEIEEGQVWEAAMFASAKGLKDLTAIVDVNGLQIDGTTEEVNSAEPIDEKFKSFGWRVITIDGHNFDEIEQAFNSENDGRPTAIIAKTIKGKGVSYMENQVGWHGKAPNADEYKIAMDELDKQEEEI